MTGEGWIAEQNAKMISSRFSNGVIHFLKKQRFAVMSYKDQQGNVWVTFLYGDPGFVEVRGERSMVINSNSFVGKTWISSSVPEQIGLIIIDTERRIRLRINGIANRESDHLVVTAHQIYGNCPKYIQKRTLLSENNVNTRSPTEHRNNRLTREQERWISKADTFYIGSTNVKGEMDVSHRGGNSGFIHIVDARILIIPDYQGNSLYNTLGNIQSNPSSGLLFIDYDHGHSLQLTGVASLIWDKEMTASFPGAALNFEIRKVVQLDNSTELRWGDKEMSPYNPDLG
ncbi:pyridoxamine 5'-phosphate oxidase family protein [Paenibacillus glycinis]|uniref:Pyridoxamine 5'-phosphate oxidase n=1 Tax=Paenibacillus glycinis TaxID=2697035 RepID=A0ABW9XZ01_9BACL|nr:pyridoxamine 5'-phosphate oxidase family protein [Paenibacillus glycinis]NBD27859.1 pyridoxamine 5'-phosphate oxidase [Paenibacillus glycinis]